MKKILILAFVATIILGCQKNTASQDQFDKHFVHTVYFWFNNPDNEKDHTDFKQSLQKFLKNSKYAKTNFIGKPAQTPREVVDNSYTYALIVTFDSKEEQDLYQKEEAHLLFIEESKHIWKEVRIYDSLGIE